MLDDPVHGIPGADARSCTVCHVGFIDTTGICDDQHTTCYLHWLIISVVGVDPLTLCVEELNIGVVMSGLHTTFPTLLITAIAGSERTFLIIIDQKIGVTG
jgi:hypothetical protein